MALTGWVTEYNYAIYSSTLTFSGGTEKNQEKHSLGWLDSQSRFKSGTFKMHASSITTRHNSVSWRNIHSHLADEALTAVGK